MCAPTLKANDGSSTPTTTLKDVPFACPRPVQGNRRPTTRLVKQTDCMYVPRVQGAVAGQTVQVENEDKTMHNVHTYKGQETILNQGQPAGSPPIKKENIASEAAVLKFKCDVHPWMSGFLVVTDHPFFQTTGADGAFKLDKVPAGKYTVESLALQFGLKDRPGHGRSEQDRGSQALVRRYRKRRIRLVASSSTNARTSLCHRTAIATFVLLIVRAWCTGQARARLPRLAPLLRLVLSQNGERGRIQHSHRLAATAVGIMTVTLTVMLLLQCEAAPHQARRRCHPAGIFQGILGGITVLSRLTRAISIAHLATSMCFFAHDRHRLSTRRRPPRSRTTWSGAPMDRRGLGDHLGQIVLGGMVRHTASGPLVWMCRLQRVCVADHVAGRVCR